MKILDPRAKSLIFKNLQPIGSFPTSNLRQNFISAFDPYEMSWYHAKCLTPHMEGIMGIMTAIKLINTWLCGGVFNGYGPNDKGDMCHGMPYFESLIACKFCEANFGPFDLIIIKSERAITHGSQLHMPWITTDFYKNIKSSPFTLWNLQYGFIKMRALLENTAWVSRRHPPKGVSL